MAEGADHPLGNPAANPPDNPLGTDRFEFAEYVAPDPGRF